MQIESDSRQQTEEQLKQLRRDEKDILEELSKHEGSMADKFRRLAKIMEERINYGDDMVTYLVHEISTNIRRFCLSHDPPILAGYHVNDYLDEKYKDPEHAKLAKLKAAINNLEYRTTRRCEQIEQCSVENLPELLEITRNEVNERDRLATEAIKLSTEKKREIEQIRQRALELGIDHLLDEEYRDPISARDYRFEIPNDADLEALNNEVVVQMERVIHQYQVFVENFKEYPGYTKEDARKWGNSARTYANMMAIVNEKKWSGETDFWLDRNYWKKAQSSHKSGNSTFFDTTLCARCSKDIDENPKDFHVTKYDKTSPTGYRCDNCGSIEIDDRFNSREQVGDKGPEVDRMASDIINHIEHYVDIFKSWRERSLNPAIYARKRAIAERFRRASMGKEELVVPRKKKKYEYDPIG